MYIDAKQLYIRSHRVTRGRHGQRFQPFDTQMCTYKNFYCSLLSPLLRPLSQLPLNGKWHFRFSRKILSKFKIFDQPKMCRSFLFLPSLIQSSRVFFSIPSLFPSHNHCKMIFGYLTKVRLTTAEKLSSQFCVMDRHFGFSREFSGKKFLQLPFFAGAVKAA